MDRVGTEGFSWAPARGSTCWSGGGFERDRDDDFDQEAAVGTLLGGECAVEHLQALGEVKVLLETLLDRGSVALEGSGIDEDAGGAGVAFDPDVDVFRAAIGEHRRQDHLGEAEERGLHRRIEIEIVLGPGNLAAELFDAAKLGQVAPQGRDEAKVVENHGPEVEDDAARLLERGADHGFEAVQLGSGLGDVAIQEAFADLGPEDDVDQGLGGAVMDLAGDAKALIFLGFDEVHDVRRCERLGMAAQRSGEGGSAAENRGLAGNRVHRRFCALVEAVRLKQVEEEVGLFLVLANVLLAALGAARPGSAS